MKYDKKIVIVGIIVLVILSVFLTIKYNCEKLHQDILMYGDKDVSAVYLVNSKIRKDNLYLDIIGPISKGNVFIDSDINIEIKDNSGTTIGKSLVKDSEIFNTSGKHITFSAMIPNITWKDRLAGIKIDMLLSGKYIDKYCINNDMSNIKLYYKGDNTTKTSVKLFYNMWRDKNKDNYVYKYGKNDYFGDTGLKTSSVFNILKEVSKCGVTNRDELTKQLSYLGASTLNPYVHLDENHNIYISIDGHNIPISQMQEETKIGIKDKAGNILKRIIKGNNKPKPKYKTIPTISDEEARKYQRK